MKNIKKSIEQSWSRIAPFWPLKNLIATNPLAGFTHLNFEQAVQQASTYFQSNDLPKEMVEVNRQTIKWLQLFFDKGEAKIAMPLRDNGLLKSVATLLEFDSNITPHQTLLKLVNEPETLIAQALELLQIDEKDHEQFLTLLLTTLTGWASYAQYQVNWGDPAHPNHPHPITHAEYLAFRILLTASIWPEAKQLLDWHKEQSKATDTTKLYQSIVKKEKQYQEKLEKKVQKKTEQSKNTTEAQLVFCIDVRSEPFRKKIESLGNYETFSMAGFFGLPIIIKNLTTGISYASCPPLITPEYTVTKTESNWNKKYGALKHIVAMYQSVKYTFATPFALAEIVGPAKGFWIFMRNFFPAIINSMRQSIFCHYNEYDLRSIPLEKQIELAQNALKAIGLTTFAPVVIFAGHASSSKNNAYKTSLDCGACAGRDGLPNAEILVQILNKKETRAILQIPETTQFFAGQHNTTTDQLFICHDHATETQQHIIDELLEQIPKNKEKKSHSLDWSQPRPEWGLARNASLIIGPRQLTKDSDLEGRAFLHSYEPDQDPDGTILENIMLGPVIVAHWINSQYLFSTLDNVAFGGGSKVTANIPGKIGIMQGNASDLMHGLALQSVYKTDTQAYHEAIRLTVIIDAPQDRIDAIINKHDILQKLVENKWIFIKTTSQKAIF